MEEAEGDREQLEALRQEIHDRKSIVIKELGEAFDTKKSLILARDLAISLIYIDRIDERIKEVLPPPE